MVQRAPENHRMPTTPRTLHVLLLTWASSALIACQDDNTAPSPPSAAEGGAVTQATSATALVATQPVTLRFLAQVGSESAGCGMRYSDIGTSNAAVTLADARLYLSDIALQDETGTWQALQLDAGSVWQSDSVALLDFEDGSAACADSGNAAQNDQVVGTLPASRYRGVRFTVGVPRALNHDDVTLAAAPLNDSTMFWNWRAGYKFLRVDWQVETTGAPARWNIHLGATGCAAAAPTTPPAEPCLRPNRARILLPDFAPERDDIRIDLGALLADSDPTQDLVSPPPGCMSSPTEPNDCRPIFATLGLDFDAGQCAGDCDDQRIFTRLAR